MKSKFERDSLNHEFHKLKCEKCGRKILVEFVLYGICHNLDIAATCADCVRLSSKFKKERPEAYRDIMRWKN